MTDLVLSADWVLPISSEPLKNGWVAIEDGLIAALGQGLAPKADRHEAYSGCGILPGLVNAHSHLGCSFLGGKTGNAGFLDWLTGNITPQVMDAYLGPNARDQRPDLRAHAKLAALTMARSGVTTVVDSFFDAIGHEVLEEIGMQGVFCREYFGSRDEDLRAYIQAMQKRTQHDVHRFGDGAVRFGLAPHALYTCPRDVLIEVFGVARENSLITTIHVGESEAEHVFFTQGKGPMVALFAPGERKERYDFGKSPVQVMSDLGLLGPGVILVHMVHVSDADLVLVAASGAGVVHCPGSNKTLQVGLAPVARMLDFGIPVALGTDSLASNDSMDLFQEMRCAMSSSRANKNSSAVIAAKSALRMATLGGAEVCGFAKSRGSIEVGKRADFAIASVDNYDEGDGISTLEQQLIDCARIRITYVLGEPRDS